MLLYLSFTAYLVYSAIGMLLYYVGVWFLFYFRKPAVQTRSNQPDKTISQFTSQPGLFTQSVHATEQKEKDSDEFPLVHDLVDELNALLLQLSAEKADKEQVASALQRLLQKYPSLKSSTFRPSVNHLIGVETENKCGLHFSAAELVDLWN